MIIVVLFSIARKCRQSRCLPIDEGILKMWYINISDIIHLFKIVKFKGKWMKLKTTFLTYASLAQKTNILCFLSFRFESCLREWGTGLGPQGFITKSHFLSEPPFQIVDAVTSHLFFFFLPPSFLCLLDPIRTWLIILMVFITLLHHFPSAGSYNGGYQKRKSNHSSYSAVNPVSYDYLGKT